MKIKSVDSTSFGIKNTFLNKAQKCSEREMIKYYQSLHYEACSRLEYKKYKHADKSLDKFKGIKMLSFSAIKQFVAMIIHKHNISSYEIKAYSRCPQRFYEPDYWYNYPHRHYETDPSKKIWSKHPKK